MKARCVFRRLTGKCPYKIIRENEICIRRLKKEYLYLKEKYRHLQEAVTRQKWEQKILEDSSYYDGFTWDSAFETARDQEVKKKEEKIKSCPFAKENCMGRSQLQQGCIRYLRRKKISEIETCNQLRKLMEELAVKRKEEKEQGLESLLTVYDQQRGWLICILWAHTIQEGTVLPVWVFRAGQDECSLLTVVCHQSSRVFEGTCYNYREDAVFLELIIKEKTEPELLLQLMASFEICQKALKKQTGSTSRRIIIYATLTGFTEAEKDKLETGALKYGVRLAGRINSQGEFRFRQLILKWLEE